MSGTAIAATSVRPGMQAFGAEPAGAADVSYATGVLEAMPQSQTIADGLRSGLSERTLRALRAHVAAIGTCSEEAIVAAMRMTWERMKIVIEPSAAVPLACLLEGVAAGQRQARRRHR